MPYKSLAQEGYFHTHRAQLERQGVDVDEWDAATKGSKLPMKTSHVDLGKKGGFAIKEGALHSMLHIPEDQKIGEARMKQASHSSNPLLAKRARSGLGLSHMHHG